MSPYRITLADDHVLLRQGLRRIVEESSELEVVGEAGDGVELIQLLNKSATDMVVLDISMPRLRARTPEPRQNSWMIVPMTKPDRPIKMSQMLNNVKPRFFGSFMALLTEIDWISDQPTASCQHAYRQCQNGRADD